MHFLPGGKKIEVLPPSSRRQATVHRTVAFDCSSLTPYKQKSPESAEADSGLLVRVARLVCICAEGADRGSPPSSRRRQRSSALHLIFRVSPPKEISRNGIKPFLLIWSEWRDSNSRHPGPKPGALPTGPHPDIKLREKARCGQICGQGNCTTVLPNFQRK